MTTHAPAPSTTCPTCFASVVVTDEICWRCERLFPGRTLWDRYEAQSQAVRAHYR